MPFAEITKRLAAEWSSLPVDQKQVGFFFKKREKRMFVFVFSI